MIVLAVVAISLMAFFITTFICLAIANPSKFESGWEYEQDTKCKVR